MGSCRARCRLRAGVRLGGASRHAGLAPENTLAPFRRALEIGVSTFETDMAVTRDGVIVISHEPVLNPDLARGPDGHWLAAPGPPIHALTLEQLRRYDIGRTDPSSRYARQFPEQQPADGERFPQLTDVFDLVKSSGKPVRLNIETKITPAAASDPLEFAALLVATVQD
jgi:glycerophosphoryl diester phosphodiesterase